MAQRKRKRTTSSKPTTTTTTTTTTRPTPRGPVFQAALCGDVEEVKHLVSRTPALLNKRSFAGKMTILNIASHEGHEELVRWLVTQPGIELNATSNPLNHTPLQCAVAQNHVAIARVLLEAGADAMCVEHDDPPLCLAIKNQSEELVRLLLELEGGVLVDVNAGAMPPLHLAVSLGNTALVRLVLAHHNVDLARPDKAYYKSAPIFHALYKVHTTSVEILQLLLDHGADLTQKSGTNSTVVHSAVSPQSLPILRFVLSAGADPNWMAGYYHQTALHICVEYNYLAHLQVLLEAGANPNIDIGHVPERTVLAKAMYKHSEEMALLLLAHNAQHIVCQFPHTSHLHIAANTGCVRVLEELLKNQDTRSCVDLLDKCNFTPLAWVHWHTPQGVQIAKHLLSAGADPNKCLQRVVATGTVEALQLVAQHGARFTCKLVGIANQKQDMIDFLTEKLGLSSKEA